MTVLVVSVTIVDDEDVLLIKENKPTAFGKWNFPSGRIEYGEDILRAARMEVKEETGFEIKLVNTTGIYHFVSSTNDQVILFHFTGKIIGGALKLEEDKIVDSKWIKVSDLIKLDKKELREASVLNRIIENLRKENVYPISIYNRGVEHGK
ncbi:NUDIX hydrolase [Peribacillus muralis]|uniref:NUDIX hydrolase n=1 Tax=Peribacillus muralis TaxID=264697 RepID=UPI00366EF667